MKVNVPACRQPSLQFEHPETGEPLITCKEPSRACPEIGEYVLTITAWSIDSSNSARPPLYRPLLLRAPSSKPIRSQHAARSGP